MREIDRNLSCALCGVHVEQYACCATHFADRRDVVDHADFVVHVHQRNEQRVGTQRGADLRRFDDAGRAGLQVRDLVAFRFEVRTRVEHGFVFDDARDDVPTALAGCFGDTFDREVVGFGGAGRPDDFARIAVQQLRDLRARFLDRLFRLPAVHVRAGCRIAEVAVGEQTVAHLLRHARIDGRGRRVVEINGFTHDQLEIS